MLTKEQSSATVGLAEAVNEEKELFGMERTIATLRKWEEESPSGILAGVNRSLKDFVGSEPQFDDLTMLCLAYYSPGEKESTASV